jgi:PKHD-type hydroxylase
MLMVVPNVLSPEQIAQFRDRILSLKFVDGTATAGWHAKLVKNNLQADRTQPGYPEVNKLVTETILQNGSVRLGVRPKAVTPLLFSRYSGGMTYGTHVDDSVIMGIRSDVSFTLALTDPQTYTGGELVMETPGGEQAFKLQAGHMIMYPSTTLHRVNPVTMGERLAAVGWMQSTVRDANAREILYDLDVARRSIFDQHGKTREFDLISKASANLLRMWTEL